MAETRPSTKVLLEPGELELPGGEDTLIVDLRKREHYEKEHIPGAVHLDTKCLVCGINPAPGKLPDPEQIGESLSAIGLRGDHHVVGYDDEGGGWAGRLLWTLDVIGHPRTSALNGGIDAWKAAGRSLSQELPETGNSGYAVRPPSGPLITMEEILAHLGDPSMALLDARTPEEHNGSKVRALKGGHIPGAVNLNWKDTMDEGRQRRLLPDDLLRDMLRARKIEPEQLVVVYCHTHHRSAHSYMMLKHLGYPNIRAYDGSWSEWGNDPDTPVEL